MYYNILSIKTNAILLLKYVVMLSTNKTALYVYYICIVTDVEHCLCVLSVKTATFFDE